MTYAGNVGATLRRWWLCPMLLSLATMAAAQDAPPPVVATPVPLAASEATQIAMPPEPVWQLVAPAAGPVAFRGLANFDQAGVNARAALVVGGGHPVLAAVTAVSFALNAAVIGHARESQKTGIQLEADKVLLPYAAILADYRNSDLYLRTAVLAPSRPAEAPRRMPWQVRASPIFSMTQDQKALVLDSLMELRSSESPTPVFAAPIRVVGEPQAQTDLTAFWQAEQGQTLRSTSEGLLAEAVRLAVQFAEASPGADAPLTAKSFRFMEGGTERVERAELLQQSCSRTVFRTLRGALMSVPTLRPEPACAQSLTKTATAPSDN